MTRSDGHMSTYLQYSARISKPNAKQKEKNQTQSCGGLEIREWANFLLDIVLVITVYWYYGLRLTTQAKLHEFLYFRRKCIAPLGSNLGNSVVACFLCLFLCMLSAWVCARAQTTATEKYNHRESSRAFEW